MRFSHVLERYAANRLSSISAIPGWPSDIIALSVWTQMKNSIISEVSAFMGEFIVPIITIALIIFAMIFLAMALWNMHGGHGAKMSWIAFGLCAIGAAVMGGLWGILSTSIK